MRHRKRILEPLALKRAKPYATTAEEMTVPTVQTKVRKIVFFVNCTKSALANPFLKLENIGLLGISVGGNEYASAVDFSDVLIIQINGNMQIIVQIPNIIPIIISSIRRDVLLEIVLAIFLYPPSFV